MIQRYLFPLCLAFALSSSLLAQPAKAPAAAEAYEHGPGSYAVATVSYDWTDTARSRKVPVKIYYPEKGQGPFPVIVFSHGLGGSRDGYEYLGRHWASHGYVSVHLQHLGSDDAVWRESKEPAKELARAAADPGNAVARPKDVSFVLDRVTALDRDVSPLKGRLDLRAIGMAGHSFGAWTTLAVAGQMMGPLQRSSLTDPRVKAAIEMSAPIAKGDLDRAYGKINMPVLHMTGTLDDSPIGDTKAAERRVPYDHIQAPGQYLVIFQGGDHMIFAGARRRQDGEGEKDARFRDLILQGTTAFWDAYLKGDAAAKAWLSRGGYAGVLGGDGKLEVK